VSAKLVLRYLPEFRILLCTGCKVAVPKERIANHARMWHIGFKGVPDLVETFKDVPAARTVAELEPCLDGSPPLSFLLPPQPGYFCPVCKACRTIDWDRLRQHVNQAHKLPLSQLRKGDLSCSLQRWTVGQGHSSSMPWIVDPESRSTTCCAADEDATNSDEATPAERTLAEMEADEEAWLCREHEQAPAVDDDLETDENSDWLRGCGWPRWFQHKPIPILLTAASLPAEGHAQRRPSFCHHLAHLQAPRGAHRPMDDWNDSRAKRHGPYMDFRGVCTSDLCSKDSIFVSGTERCGYCCLVRSGCYKTVGFLFSQTGDFILKALGVPLQVFQKTLVCRPKLLKALALGFESFCTLRLGGQLIFELFETRFAAFSMTSASGLSKQTAAHMEGSESRSRPLSLSLQFLPALRPCVLLLRQRFAGGTSQGHGRRSAERWGPICLPTLST